MNQRDLYRRLVDLYADQELPQELEDALEEAAIADPMLMVEMVGLKRLVEKLRDERDGTYTDETRQRILAKLCIYGVDVDSHLGEPAHYQYALPMNG